jgi:predicted Ser/Thr protein kinase
VLAERYRIVGLLGRGGMGEVYRADDLKLGQPVALKFLPAALERDESRLARFLNEVKLARQVSHPNVCRVYDVGELEGQHFLSMEYVDGEDLGSLLRRIGHLPRDKAVQLSRQLCWGLAAAHELGILHRDIKPANVMIDGRGNAKLTDFGLADLAGTIAGAEVVAGTPAYMAPEQLAGKAVSARSDVYSLGLVMYELFTGKQPFDRAKTPRDLARVRSESTPTDPSSHVESFDPVVERVILRCLEQDPANRPASALAVAAALPGGDPLSAALAAGETPSPEMVAEAGEKGGMSPLIGLPLWTVVVAGLIGLVAIVGQGYRKLPLPNAPEELIVRARDVIRDVGHDNKTGDHFFDLWINHTAVNYFAERGEPHGGSEHVRSFFHPTESRSIPLPRKSASAGSQKRARVGRVRQSTSRRPGNDTRIARRNGSAADLRGGSTDKRRVATETRSGLGTSLRKGRTGSGRFRARGPDLDADPRVRRSMGLERILSRPGRSADPCGGRRSSRQSGRVRGLRTVVRALGARAGHATRMAADPGSGGCGVRGRDAVRDRSGLAQPASGTGGSPGRHARRAVRLHLRQPVLVIGHPPRRRLGAVDDPDQDRISATRCR